MPSEAPTLRVVQRASHSPRSADLSGRHTRFIGCFDKSGKLRTVLPEGYEWTQP